MYQIRVLEPAIRDLATLDATIARRVARRIEWLAEHLDDVRLDVLTGDLSGFFKLRVGDYRVMYEVLRPSRTIVVHLIGHRSEVYRSHR